MLGRLCGILVFVGGCAAYAPAVPLVSSRPVVPSRCDAPRLDYEDSAMKDINRVGVSDKRQQEINELMNKLRGRGSVGSSSDTGDSERFLARPRPANPVELAARELAVKEDVSGPEVAAEALAASAGRPQRLQQPSGQRPQAALLRLRPDACLGASLPHLHLPLPLALLLRQQCPPSA